MSERSHTENSGNNHYVEHIKYTRASVSVGSAAPSTFCTKPSRLEKKHACTQTWCDELDVEYVINTGQKCELSHQLQHEIYMDSERNHFFYVDSAKPVIIDQDMADQMILTTTNKDIQKLGKKRLSSQQRRLLKRKNGIKPYECYIGTCRKAFYEQHRLDLHIVIHSTFKLYACDQCTSSFRSLQSLKRHKLIHRNMYPYRCTAAACFKQFRHQSSLLRHTRLTHSNEMPFSCPVCGDPSPIPVSQQHQDLHSVKSGMRGISCPYQDQSTLLFDNTVDGISCDLHFSNEHCLSFHVKKTHDANRPLMIRSETLVYEALKRKFGKELVQYDHENTLDASCVPNKDGAKRYRPDLRVLCVEIDGYPLHCFIEIDEFQHRRDACDLSRMIHIYQLLRSESGPKPADVLFIRFNPHAYRVDQVKHDPKI